MNSEIQELLYELKQNWIRLSTEERSIVNNCDTVFNYIKTLPPRNVNELQDILDASKGHDKPDED